MSKHFLNIPAIYRLGTRGIGYLPTSVSYVISQIIADLSYIFYRAAVSNVKKNLSLAFPVAAEKELSKAARQLFRNYSKYLVDYGRFTNLDKNAVLQNIVCFDGRENLDIALQMNKGLILLTAHIGNWELGGIFFSSYGIRTNVVTVPDSDPKIDYMRRWYRDKHKVNTITIGKSPFSIMELVKALNNKEVVAMLIDRYNGGDDSTTVDFFNKPTFFPRGPFILGRLTGSPIVVAFVVREGDGYRGIVEEPFVVTKENEEEIIKKVVKLLEKYIIMYPTQWYNFILV